jgi:hypothetical protein
LSAVTIDQESKTLRHTASIVAVFLILIGLALRLWPACATELWCDEAESSINALTILETGLPEAEYLGLPIYENTLTLAFPESEEYEFKDSSYSSKGLTVYHGWLPLYSIAFAQALFGLTPDRVTTANRTSLRPRHTIDEIFIRSIAPRLPSLLFSVAYLVILYRALRAIAGSTAALTALLWFSLNADSIDFGYQARYYSLTLLLSAICAVMAWRLYQHGGWRDYLYLGLAEAALFHTHQLSAVVFAITCISLLPSILKHPKWPQKCALAASVAALLTVPWAVWAGFFTTASEVPKAYHLFTTRSDWFNYLIERPTALIMILSLAGLNLWCNWRRRNHAHKESHAIILFLIVWMAVAFTAFHLLVPAASFFYERLTLIALTPFGCTFGIVISQIIPNKGKTLPLLFGAFTSLLLLALNKDLPRVPKTSNIDRPAIFQYLASLPERTNNRIYATPSEHLVWTYYTGVPVQSIAPIRKSFLDSYTGRIVYLETYPNLVIPEIKSIATAAEAAQVTLSETELEALSAKIVRHLAQRHLFERGLSQSPEEQEALPAYLSPLVEAMYDATIELNNSSVRRIKKLIVFRELPFDTISDLWISFFYRFVDPASRIGSKSNIRQVQAASTISLYPMSRTIIFLREELANQAVKR